MQKKTSELNIGDRIIGVGTVIYASGIFAFKGAPHRSLTLKDSRGTRKDVIYGSNDAWYVEEPEPPKATPYRTNNESIKASWPPGKVVTMFITAYRADMAGQLNFRIIRDSRQFSEENINVKTDELLAALKRLGVIG